MKKIGKMVKCSSSAGAIQLNWRSTPAQLEIFPWEKTLKNIKNRKNKKKKQKKYLTRQMKNNYRIYQKKNTLWIKPHEPNSRGRLRCNAKIEIKEENDLTRTITQSINQTGLKIDKNKNTKSIEPIQQQPKIEIKPVKSTRSRQLINTKSTKSAQTQLKIKMKLKFKIKLKIKKLNSIATIKNRNSTIKNKTKKFKKTESKTKNKN